jgi:hypothetical protein
LEGEVSNNGKGRGGGELRMYWEYWEYWEYWKVLGRIV